MTNILNDSNSSIDLEPIGSEEEDYNSSPSRYRIINYPADFTLEVLYQQWKSEEIIIPSFQRQFVWRKPQASKLIESFLLGLPVPSIFLYKESDGDQYLVIDGQQRLKSIYFFMDGHFDSQSTAFRLVGLNEESPFSGKSYDDLSETEQRKFKNSILRAFIIQQVDPEDNTSIFQIFQRLNTGGTLLANQEIRNCIYHGNFVEFLEKLNTYSEWRKILGKNDPDRRLKDIELILRFFAISSSSSYKKPMKEYLSDFMKSYRYATKECMLEMEKRFENTCTNVINSLGEKPFHIRSGMNSAVFDSVMYAFYHNSGENTSDIQSRFNTLIGNDEYIRCIQSSTTDERIVSTRLSLASKVLFPK